ncbi:COMPASS (complex proteins associated with Set1p) component [Lambiella insularis]|nr:COMPASS (complex proteins associated with Set1p) component [Lambiella insularis]
MPSTAPIPNTFTDSPVPTIPVPVSLPAALTSEQQDTTMADAAPSHIPQQNIAPSALLAPRTSTPVRNTNGVVVPEPAPMPSKAAPHGAPARRYLNEKVTGVVLEGMKRLAADQPEDPLRVLGEYLLQRSKDLEGGSGGMS